MVDYFNELDLAVALITESWLSEGKKLQHCIDDLNDGENIQILQKSRKSRRGRTAGSGVVIAHDTNKIKLKPFPISCGKAEIIAATGRIANNQRVFVFFSIYISPKTKAKQTQETLDALSDAILIAKTTFRDPIVIVGGDFNKKEVEPATAPFPDIRILPTSPTRGRSTLDLIATNLTESDVNDVFVCEPLKKPDGQQSDHNVIAVKTTLHHSDCFMWNEFNSRPLTNKGCKIFRQKNLQLMVEESFPIKKHLVRSIDDPWITPQIRN